MSRLLDTSQAIDAMAGGRMPGVTCRSCVHYVPAESMCQGWEYATPVEDPAASARTCRRYTDIYGREVEIVDGAVQFKPSPPEQKAPPQQSTGAGRAKLRRPDVTNERIHELFSRGLSNVAIAREVGLTDAGVRWRLRRLGLHRPSPAVALPAARSSEVVISAEQLGSGLRVDVHVTQGATLRSLIELLRAIGGGYPSQWRVHPVGMQVVRDAPGR